MFGIAACLEDAAASLGSRVRYRPANAGGAWRISLIDACVAAGLRAVEFSEPPRESDCGRSVGSHHQGNPVDMIASAGPPNRLDGEASVERSATGGHALIVIYTPVDRSTAQNGVRLPKGYRVGPVSA